MIGSIVLFYYIFYQLLISNIYLEIFFEEVQQYVMTQQLSTLPSELLEQESDEDAELVCGV